MGKKLKIQFMIKGYKEICWLLALRFFGYHLSAQSMRHNWMHLAIGFMVLLHWIQSKLVVAAFFNFLYVHVCWNRPYTLKFYSAMFTTLLAATIRFNDLCLGANHRANEVLVISKPLKNCSLFLFSFWSYGLVPSYNVGPSWSFLSFCLKGYETNLKMLNCLKIMERQN